MEKNRRVWKPESHIFLLIIKCLLIYVPTGCSSQAPQLKTVSKNCVQTVSKNWTHVYCFSVYLSVRNTNSLEPSDRGRDTDAGKPGAKRSLPHSHGATWWPSPSLFCFPHLPHALASSFEDGFILLFMYALSHSDWLAYGRLITALPLGNSPWKELRSPQVTDSVFQYLGKRN